MKTLASFGLQVAVILTLFILTRANFARDMLAMHNEYRAKHNTPDLKLNMAGCFECKEYAKELANKNELEHSDTQGAYGENLCLAFDPLDCVAIWYEEIRAYDFNNPMFSPATAHFTQLIWRDTKFLAVGTAKGKKGIHYVVARYTPPGNVEGEFERNVPKRNFADRLYYPFRPYFLTRLTFWLLPIMHLQVFCQD